MKNALYLILLIAFPATIYAQDTIFVRSYGQSGYNYGEKVIQLADTGYVILGNKSGFVGNTDVYLLRTNYCGNYMWDKAYGGSEVDWAEDIVATKDKGYAIAGYMSVPTHNNDYDVMLIKTDSLGVMQWMKHYGGSSWDMGHSLIETPDSGFVIAGETYSSGNGNNDIFLMKTNKNGDSLWSKTYGGPAEDVAFDISKCHDGNFIVAGKTNSFGKGGYDMYLLKINPAGDTLWTKTYGDTLDDFAFSGIEANDHGIVIVGSTRDYGVVGLDGMLLKTDSVGNQLWHRTYGGSGDEEYYDLAKNKDHGFMIAGYTTSFGAGKKDFTMVITNPDGWFIGGTTYGGSEDDVSKACIATSDNGYAILGSTQSMGLAASNILFVKTDSAVHTNASTYIHITDIAEVNNDEKTSCYPNPVAEKLTIVSPKSELLLAVRLYDQLGQLVYQKSEAGTEKATIDFSCLPAGLYLLIMDMKNDVRSEKILHVDK